MILTVKKYSLLLIRLDFVEPPSLTREGYSTNQNLIFQRSPSLMSRNPQSLNPHPHPSLASSCHLPLPWGRLTQSVTWRNLLKTKGFVGKVELQVQINQAFPKTGEGGGVADGWGCEFPIHNIPINQNLNYKRNYSVKFAQKHKILAIFT